jgi:hypothetical protein
MRKNYLVLLALFWAVVAPVSRTCGQTVTTQVASNITSSSAVLRGVVNCVGSNTSAWFLWDTVSSIDPANELALVHIGNGATNVSVAGSLSGLPSGTRVWFRCAASNDVGGGVVKGGIENFVTAQVSYELTGYTFADIDITRPQGSEPGYVWDDALRQFKAWTVGFLQAQHRDNGVHADNFLTTAMIQDQAVILDKLSQDVQDRIAASGTGAVSSVVFSNAVVYAGSVEADSDAIEVTESGVTLGGVNIPSNGWRHVMVTAEVEFSNRTADAHDFSAQVGTLQPLITISYTNDGKAHTNEFLTGVIFERYGPVRLTPKYRTYIPVSALFDGGQPSNTVVSVVGFSDRPRPNRDLTSTLKSVRAWGIP